MMTVWAVTIWILGLIPVSYIAFTDGRDPCELASVGVNGYVSSCESTYIATCPNMQLADQVCN